jgi:hypothetical protein
MENTKMNGNERNAQAAGTFKEWVSTIGAVLGFFIALVSFTVNIQEWTQEPGSFRSVSLAGFVLYFVSSIWFAFRGKNVKSAWRWASLGLLYVCTVLYCIWVGTWIGSAASLQPVDTTNTSELPLHVRIANVGWEAMESSDYALTIAIAEVCINSYENEATQVQQGLLTSGKPLPPIGAASDDERGDILSHGVLNELASCFWMKGHTLEKLNHISEARQAYTRTQQFTYARVWDPTKEVFWSPAEDATERLDKLP